MLQDLLDLILNFLKSRLVPLVLAFVLLFIVLINRIFSLQIMNGSSYVQSLTDSIEMTQSVAATRGRIFDKNGKLLAYNELAHAVKISDSGKYANNAVKNEKVNGAIETTLNIIESKNDKFSNEFQIVYENDKYEYNVSGSSLLRFLRDIYGKTSISELTEEEKNASAKDSVDYLVNRYGVDTSLKPSHILEILNLRVLMSANSYNRYIEFTIANEVSDETVAAILEGAYDLVGVTVEEQYVRKYVDSIYTSQILGYTGTVSSSELETLKQDNPTYENNDIVGKAGIEKSMESVLAGEKGSKTVYVDTVGRITEVVDQTDSKAGQDVYLTIDLDLQKDIYNIIENNLRKIILDHLSSGSTKITYFANGDIDNIYILIDEVYFGLIDNNLVDIGKLESMDSNTAKEVFNQFNNKYDNVMSMLESELGSSPTAYGSLDDEDKVYIWYIYKDLLKAEKIIDSSKVDSNDSTYKDWTDGDSTSLEAFLRYAIVKNWIDMSSITDNQYSSLDEAYEELKSYIFDALKTDKNFKKKMYKYMINSGSISGRQVCMLLFEQGYLHDDATYQSLSSGALGSYDFIQNSISNNVLTPGELALQPCAASCVITNPNDGDVIALVAYPSYDNNKLSGSIDMDYYKKLNEDKATPLINWATQAQSAPGSTFKVCTSIAGLDTGVISDGSSFNCNGAFEEVSPPPRCWLRTGHGTENVATALRDSCNVFFFNVGYRLATRKNGSFNNTYATSVLKKYAEELGLATKSGIEISERSPHASTDEALASAIGQGTHQYSTVNLARYVNTVANSGTCYNLTLIDKVTDYDGNLIYDNHATVANRVEINPSIWNTVHYGMSLVPATYNALGKVKMTFAAKSGTAQENKSEADHALMISYAPYDNPEIAMAVSIPHGYSGSQAAYLTADVLNRYFHLEGDTSNN